MSLENIGQIALAALPESTGRELGKPGSAISLDSARRWLLDHKPEDVDRALRTSLRSSLNVGLQPHEEMKFPVEGGYRTELVAYSVSDADGNAGAALDRVQAALTPARVEQIEEWLAILQVATAGAKRSETGSLVALTLYAGALTQFPADVAKAACEHFTFHSKWFPVLADLIEHCERLANPRFKMTEALRNRSNRRG